MKKTSDALEILKKTFKPDEKKLKQIAIKLSLASTFYKARIRLHLTQKQIAKRLGCSVSVIEKIEDADW